MAPNTPNNPNIVTDTPLSPPAEGHADAPPPTATPRSPVERAVVWGAILVLLIVVLIEFRAKSAHSSDKKAVEDAESAIAGGGSGDITESTIKGLMTRYSTYKKGEERLGMNQLAANRVDTYEYRGVLKSRVLYVYYGAALPGKEQQFVSITEEPVKVLSKDDLKVKLPGEGAARSAAGGMPSTLNVPGPTQDDAGAAKPATEQDDNQKDDSDPPAE